MRSQDSAQHTCAFVSGRLPSYGVGTCAACDHNGGFALRETTARRRTPGAPLRRPTSLAFVDGDLVWVRLTALPQFLERCFRTLKCAFALVTGDEDWSIPIRLRARSRHHREPECALLVYPELRRHRRLERFSIPIGLDFHTIAVGTGGVTGRRRHPAGSGARRATNEMPANAARLVRAHADFHFNKRDNAFDGNATHDPGDPEARSRVDFSRASSRCELWREKLAMRS